MTLNVTHQKNKQETSLLAVVIESVTYFQHWYCTVFCLCDDLLPVRGTHFLILFSACSLQSHTVVCITGCRTMSPLFFAETIMLIKMYQIQAQ